MNTRATLSEALNPEGRVWVGPYYLTPGEVQAMRELVDDRLSGSAEEGNFDWLTDRQVVEVIARTYPKGVRGFVGHGCDKQQDAPAPV